MSDQDIIDTIADDFNTEIVGNSIDYNGGRLTLSRSRDLAAQALAALRAGYVIVKLPEPEYGPDGEGQYGWTTPVASVSTCDGRVWEEDCDIEPHEARAHAAALLAAANYAEEDK